MSGSREFPAPRHPVPTLLSTSWVDHLTRTATEYDQRVTDAPTSWRQFAVRPGHESPELLGELLADVPGAFDPLDGEMAEACGYATLALRMRTGANETLCAVSWRVLKNAAEGHPGADYALQQVIGAFITENDRRRRRGLKGVRTNRELDSEIRRAVFGAIRKIGAQGVGA